MRGNSLTRARCVCLQYKQCLVSRGPHLPLEESVLDDWGVVGVFFRRLSKKLTPLEIRLEKLRLRFSPKRGLK